MRWRVGEGRAVGSFALLVSVISYASPPEQRMLWRWSYVEAGILAAIVLLFGLTLLGLFQPATGPIDAGYRAPGSRAAAHWVDFGWALWGLGYLIGSAFVPASHGRLFRLDLLGSVIPGASFLEWGGVVAVLIAIGILLWRRVGRRSWPLAVLLTLPLVAIALGEGWARWQAMYRPLATELPSATQERWDRAHVTLNGDGFRDVIHELPKPPGGFRLLLVGGSAAYGVGIADPDDRLSELLAVGLGAATHRPWESVNVGRIGTHTKDHLGILRDALRWRPDVVVLLYEFDDIEYFTPVERRELLAESPSGWPGRLHPLRLLYTNSILFQEFFLRLRARFPAYTGTGPLAHDPYADPMIVTAHLEDIQAFVQAVEETGAAALVVPLDLEVGSDSTRLARYRAFVAAAAAAQIPVVGVDSALAGRPVERLIVGPLDHSPNELADRLVAGAVAPQVMSLLGPNPGEATAP